MVRKSTKQPTLIGRGHRVPNVKPTFEDLDKLELDQLRKYAKSADMKRPKLSRKALLRFVCVLNKIHHPDDGVPSPIHESPPSSTLLSVSRRAAASGAMSVVQPPAEEAIASASRALPKYPAGRVNKLDTRRFSPPPENEELIAADYLDPEGFNRPAPNSTPEPDERPVQAPPADAESLEQTVKMLQAFRERNEDLAKQVKKITGTAQALKKTTADLIQSGAAQRAARVRMELYINYYRQEQPTFAHEAVFLPNDLVFVSVDEQKQRITDEMDAMDEDLEEDFAIFKAAKMLERAHSQKSLKRTASSLDLSNIETDSYLEPARQNKRPSLDQLEPPTENRFALHREHLWEGINFISDGGQGGTSSPRSTKPDTTNIELATTPDSNDLEGSGKIPAQPTNEQPQYLTRQKTVYADDKIRMSVEEELAQQPELRPEGSRIHSSALDPGQGGSEVEPELAPMPPADSESRRQASYSALSTLQQHPIQQNGIAPSASRPRRGLRRQESHHDGGLQ